MSTELPNAFDPSFEEGSTNFTCLPAGNYPVEIIEASVDVPHSGDGKRANFTLQVVDGDYENRHLWWGITVEHSSAQAQEIGRRQFKDLCDATNVTEVVTDVDVFKHVPFTARVKVASDPNKIYSDRNKIVRVFHLNGAGTPAGIKPVGAPIAAKARKSLAETLSNHEAR